MRESGKYSEQEPGKDKCLSRKEFIKMGLCGLASCVLGTGELSSMGKAEKSKWIKEAIYYTKEGKVTYCDLCPNECVIRPGKIGDCQTRINKNGKLYSIAYGNPCAMHIDPIEKKPLFHFLPESKAFSIATAGCNLSCLNCQNWDISQTSPEKTRNYDLLPGKLVKTALEYKCQSIAYTYSEPIVFYEYVYDSSKLAHEKGIKNLFISAGYIKEKPLRKLSRYLDAANIDLKSFKDSIYKKLNGGTLQPVLDSLLVLHDENVWLEITNLIVPNWTDDMKMIKDMCRWLVNNKLDKYPLHFSRFTPMYKLARLPSTPVETLIKARQTALDAGMKYVYIGNVPGSNAESTFCPGCGKTVIKRRGFYILEKKLKKGKCGHCGERIHGVWE